jgi:hypothetical protein
MTDLPRPEKRKPLTRVQFATLLLGQSGRCGCGCGKKLQPDAIIDEHLVALDFLGSNELDNRSLWDRDCSKRKTAGDLSEAAKGKRIRRETGQQARRERRGHGSINAPPVSQLSRDARGYQKKAWPKRKMGK